MAIFYEKIKGCSTDTTGSGDKDLWSIVKWGGVPNNSNWTTKTIDNFNLVFIPSLEVHGSSNEDTAKYNFGNFLVAGPTPASEDKYDKGQSYYGQYIYTDLCFGKKGSKLYVEHIEGLKNTNKTISFNECVNITKDTLTVQGDTVSFVMKDNSKQAKEFYKIDISSTPALTSEIQQLTFNNIKTCIFSANNSEADSYPFQFTGAVKMDGDTLVTGSLTASSKVEALYFNATSDSRAKTILGKVPNALSTIVDTPIYEYFYTDDAKKTELIGILAQDLLKNGDEFHIVNNQSATGVNGDFMTIKEDRLTFVLWKALQELTEEVKELRNEVNELRGGK